MVQEYAATKRAREEEIYQWYAPTMFVYLLHHVPIQQDAKDLIFTA